jgi:hypothetical protein
MCAMYSGWSGRKSDILIRRLSAAHLFGFVNAKREKKVAAT